MTGMKHRWRMMGLSMAAAVAAGVTNARADDQTLLDKVSKLEQRVAELEGKAVTTNSMPAATLAFLGQTALTGYVSGSYFHNFNDAAPANNVYVTKQDQFAANKLKLALAKPVDYSPTKWDAGFRADVVVGEDAKAIHAAGLGTDVVDLEQAFVSVNVPIGNGLKVTLGKEVTMMGVEVVEETANPNWTLGNQFKYVENTTHLGLHVAYKFSDKVEAMVGVYNGWDVVTDNNNGRSFMGKVNLTLCDATSLALVGYGGPEQAGDSRDWRHGVDAVLTQKLGSKITTYGQLDYGHEENAPGAGRNADWFAGGFWFVYQATDKVGVALRADYLKDGDSTRTFAGGLPGVTLGTDAELTSLTLTLNITPVENLQVRPEVRWDHCSENAFTDGAKAENDQFLAGIGVAYLF